VRVCPVASSHFSPGAAPQVGQGVASIRFGLSSFFTAGRFRLRTREQGWSILNTLGQFRKPRPLRSTELQEVKAGPGQGWEALKGQPSDPKRGAHYLRGSLATVSDQSPDCQRKRSTFGPSRSCHNPAQHWHAVRQEQAGFMRLARARPLIGRPIKRNVKRKHFSLDQRTGLFSASALCLFSDRV
jgi:hypothetical protein